MSSKTDAILSSHKDAARRVGDFLRNSHGLDLKPAITLEIVAKVLGAANWQTLSAMAKQGRAPRMSDVEQPEEKSPQPPSREEMRSLAPGFSPGLPRRYINNIESPTKRIFAHHAEANVIVRTSENGASPVRPFLPDFPVISIRPPTKSFQEGFLWEIGDKDFTSNDKTGKWCIFRPAAEIDALWLEVRKAVKEGHFVAAMCSTFMQARYHGGSYVICAFTSDWSDREDVMRAWQVLRDMGVTEELGYKRDLETKNGVYRVPEEWFYRA